VIGILKGLKRTKEDYYQIRDAYNSETNRLAKAAYFIYLNKTCWNGLYRVNRQGRFNVPIGKFKASSEMYNEEQLLEASKALKKAELRNCDFEEGVRGIKPHDLVYFDPPYITTHLKNGFSEYNAKLFSQTDELRLAALADKLCKKGMHVVVSNAAHPLIKRQYNGVFYKNEFERASLIAGDPTKRSKFMELLITSFPMGQENF
jgi:DNA adenine methylase